MAVISIQYDEGSEAEGMGYESVEIAYANLNKREVFNSGDFVKDWYDAVKFIIQSNNEEHVALSSSCHHFIMDGAPYDSAYLKTDEGKAYLVYEYDYDDPEIELFVEKGTKPTWEELKERMK